MVTYRPILQSFPARVVDLASQTEGYRHITIVTEAEAKRGGEEEDDGWLFLIVDADTIDLELTRKTVAKAIEVKLEDVIIEDETRKTRKTRGTRSNPRLARRGGPLVTPTSTAHR